MGKFINAIKLAFGWGPGWLSSVEKTGVAAQAVVLSDPAEIIKGLGYEGGDKWVSFQGRVEPPDGAPYDSKIYCRLSCALSGAMAVGGKVNVKYDPADRTRVALADDVSALLKSRIRR